MTDTHHTASTMIAEIADLREKLRVAEAAREEAERLADRRWKERADVLHVKTVEGLTCSEWLLRTGVAERERDEWKARAEKAEAACAMWRRRWAQEVLDRADVIVRDDVVAEARAILAQTEVMP